MIPIHFSVSDEELLHTRPPVGKRNSPHASALSGVSTQKPSTNMEDRADGSEETSETKLGAEAKSVGATYARTRGRSSPEAADAGGTKRLSVSSGPLPVLRISCRSPRSMRTRLPARKGYRCPLTTASPEPRTMNSHWSAPRWRLSGPPSDSPGPRVIWAAWARSFERTTLNPRPNRRCTRFMPPRYHEEATWRRGNRLPL